MRTHGRATAAALIALGLAGLTIGCTRTTPGTVAMTTEPGPTTAPTAPRPGIPMPTLPSIPNLPGFPLPTRDTSVPEVPAPANALTMGCSDYLKLDDATRLAVVKAILAEGKSPLATLGPDIAKTIPDTTCQFMPDATVKDMLTAGS